MIEVTLSYAILSNIELEAYGEWAKKALEGILQAPGLVEFRANRNLLGDPQVRSTTVWRSLADWAKYNESNEWRALEEEARGFISNIKVEIWGPSPIVPEPIRPS